jgi:flagellar L-ring protein precursor FlgH
MYKRRVAMLIVLLAATWSVVRADSIWQRRDPRASDLFQDNRARSIGDNLTIEINEATEANQKDQRALEKGHSNKASFTYGGATKGDNSSTAGSGNISLGTDSSRQFNGSAQLTSDRKFTDRITVTVVDVLPNGNLVLEGYRSRIVAGETRVLRITGIVRPADIGQQNTVESRFVAKFLISYLGRGPETTYTNQGWFSRMMSHIWPF